MAKVDPAAGGCYVVTLEVLMAKKYEVRVDPTSNDPRRYEVEAATNLEALLRAIEIPDFPQDVTEVTVRLVPIKVDGSARVR